jgi:hypothetical protein
MRDVFDNLTVNVLGKFHRSLCTARGAYPPAFTGKRNKEGVLAAIAIHPSGAVSEDAAIEVLIESLQHLIP